MPSVPGTSEAQAAFALTVFDEFARAGMRDVVVCAGSRSTPLAIAAASTSAIRLHVRLDERSAGFFAIGRALVTHRPVGVVVTSGTAAAELHAAVVEADLARVALVVVTADRPPELRGVGAPQTIDQVKLFGASVRRFEDPGPIRADAASSWRALAARVVAASFDGPVHLNVPLVEPLVATPSAVPPGREGGAAWIARARPARRAMAPLDEASIGEMPTRVAVVAGRGGCDPDVLLEAAAAHGWAVLADPLGGARRRHPCVVGAFDPLLRDESLRDRLRPDLVLCLGAMPSSRVLASALATWRPRVVAVTATEVADDPSGVVTDVVVADPTAWVTSVAPPADSALRSAYLSAWRAADDAAQATFDALLATELSEPAVARLLSRVVPHDAALVVSSSMPVRDLEWFAASPDAPPRYFANRGANGIDGVVSTTLGASIGGRGVGLVGDLAFLHDAGSLSDGLGADAASCVLVVVDNHGGGIFSFLAQRTSIDHDSFERLFATPPRVEVASVAAGYGTNVVVAKDLGSVGDAVGAGLAAPGITVVVAEVPDRDRNVEVHTELVDAATAAARAALDALDAQG